jgi:endonuclease YncB( thermonuclease family)
MARPYQIFIPMLSLFLVRVDLTDLHPLQLKVKLLTIYDGDTVFLSHGSYRFKLRFSKIDSPEMGQSFLSGLGGGGEMSLQCLRRLLKKEKTLTVQIEGTDIYKRYLGDVNHLSLSLIKEGCTTIYPYARFSSKKEKFNYLTQFKNAKAHKKGLWSLGGLVQPKFWRRANKQISNRR